MQMHVIIFSIIEIAELMTNTVGVQMSENTRELFFFFYATFLIAYYIFSVNEYLAFV